MRAVCVSVVLVVNCIFVAAVRVTQSRGVVDRL